MKPRGKFPPIPTPFAQRVRQARMTLLPGLVLVGALVVIANLWRDRISPPTMVERTDGGMANSPSRQPGDLPGLRPEWFQKITAGEPLANIGVIPDPKHPKVAN